MVENEATLFRVKETGTVDRTVLRPKQMTLVTQSKARHPTKQNTSKQARKDSEETGKLSIVTLEVYQKIFCPAKKVKTARVVE